jgi:hypothetical protein
MNMLIVPISFIIGIVYCFFGFRLFKIIVGLMGFGLGAALGNLITKGDPAGLFIGGVIGSILTITFLPVAIFVTGAILGGLISVFLGSIGLNNTIFTIIFAIGGGILALILKKFILIISTSFSGAYLIIISLEALSGNYNIYFNPYLQDKPIIIFITLILGFIGILNQYGKLNSILIQPFSWEKIKITKEEIFEGNSEVQERFNNFKYIKGFFNSSNIDFLSSHSEVPKAVLLDQKSFPFKLKQISGIDQGKIYDIIGQKVGSSYKSALGRHIPHDQFPEANITIPNYEQAISRFQAEFRFQNDEVVIKNISTSNTISLNGSPLNLNQAAKLVIGDKLNIGDLVFIVV